MTPTNSNDEELDEILNELWDNAWDLAFEDTNKKAPQALAEAKQAIHRYAQKMVLAEFEKLQKCIEKDGLFMWENGGSVCTYIADHII